MSKSMLDGKNPRTLEEYRAAATLDVLSNRDAQIAKGVEVAPGIIIGLGQAELTLLSGAVLAVVAEAAGALPQGTIKFPLPARTLDGKAVPLDQNSLLTVFITAMNALLAQRNAAETTMVAIDLAQDKTEVDTALRTYLEALTISI